MNTRSQWSSTSLYLLVTIGAVVGLGNIIQFPFLISEYGGLFIVFYILCELLVSVPLFLGELLIGRRGKQNPVGSLTLLSLESQASRRWRGLGWLSVLIAFFTLCYYSVQAAFPLAYFFGSVKALSRYGVDELIPVAIDGKMMTQFFPVEICFILFLAATLWVVVRGINRGLETISKIIVPAYFIILLILACFTVYRVGLFSSLAPLFHVAPNQPILPILFAAMAYAFLKLNVGMGTMIVYGSYLPFSTSFGKSTAVIVLFDAVVSLLAYFVIYPLMIESNAHAFVSNITNHNVIYVFSSVPYGILIASLFFLCAVMAAWTCTIAMAETVAVTLIERFQLSRPRAVMMIFIAAVLLGSFAAMTHTQWLNVMLTENLRLAGILKNTTENVLEPLAALLIAIFVGWALKKSVTRAELAFKPGIQVAWLFLVRYLAPIFIVIVVILSML